MQTFAWAWAQMSAVAFSVVICAAPIHAQDANRPIDDVVVAHYPPFSFESAPERPGLAIEILQTAARRQNRELNIDFLPFQRVIHTLEKRTDVMTPILFRSKPREDNFTWIAQILNEDLGFMTFGPAIDSFEDAKKLVSIVVESNSSSAQVLINKGFDNLVFVNTTESSIQMLEANRVDAWFQSASTGKAVLKEFDFRRDLTFGNTVQSVRAYLTGAKGFPADVAKQYKEAILGMQRDGTIEALQEKYRPRGE